MSEMHAYLCRTCGYDGFRAGEVKSMMLWTADTVPAAVSFFCPVCMHLLHRADLLGDIEAEAHGTPHFEELFPDGPGIYAHEEGESQ